MKVDPVQTALGALDDIPLRTPEGRTQILKALAGKSNLVAAKAARKIGDAQWAELKDDLVSAFSRFLRQGSALDKGCNATAAIARALFALDYDGPELYLSGMRHVQMEAVWGGSVDTAAELRAVCAMGLASCPYPHKLRELVNLLVDEEAQARTGAIRAIATAGSETAALLLRLKALSGDKDPNVMGDCLSELLAVEGASAIPFVISFTDAQDKAIAEASFLALGATRRPEAIDWLKGRFGQVADSETRQSILLALAASRTDAAMAFLLDVIRDGSSRSSEIAVSAMQVNSADPRIREEIARALEERK
ncbi:MAG TPA: HEAT repeat domain-containing protein [Bryobacteraceae bacterium]|nr:HEAT repeat domain-containing protein [Bryobacteraceae bacterium]